RRGAYLEHVAVGWRLGRCELVTHGAYELAAPAGRNGTGSSLDDEDLFWRQRAYRDAGYATVLGHVPVRVHSSPFADRRRSAQRGAGQQQRGVVWGNPLAAAMKVERRLREAIAA